MKLRPVISATAFTTASISALTKLRVTLSPVPGAAEAGAADGAAACASAGCTGTSPAQARSATQAAARRTTVGKLRRRPGRTGGRAIVEAAFARTSARGGGSAIDNSTQELPANVRSGHR